jgi:hypothetical protein
MPTMSKTEILKKLPKLTKTERQRNPVEIG